MITRKHMHLIAEFFIVGLLMGVIEDVIAIALSTDAQITWRVVGIAAFVALPFAIFSEIIVDQARIKRMLKKESEKIKQELDRVI